MGIATEKIVQQLKIDSSLLFWIFPGDLKFYQLNSLYQNSLLQSNYRTTLYYANGQNDYELEFSYQTENFKLQSSAFSLRNNQWWQTEGFRNDNKWTGSLYSTRYTMLRKANDRNNISLTLLNSFKHLNANFEGNAKKYTFWLPEYAISYAHKINTFNQTALSLSFSKKLPTNSEIFSDSIVNNGNSIIRGYTQPYTNRTLSLEFRHTLTDLSQKQWLSFSFIKMNFIRDDYIRSFSANAFFYQYYFTYYPSNSTELTILHSSQKLINRLSLKLSANLSYLQKNLFTLNNSTLQHSILNFISSQVSLKSVFKGKWNFEINSTLRLQYSKARSLNYFTTRSRSNIQKLSIYYVANRDFFITTSFSHNVIKAKAQSNYSFWDISVTKKIFKEKLQLEVAGKNLLNKKEFSSVMISPFYIEEDKIFLRGIQAIISLKYFLR